MGFQFHLLPPFFISPLSFIACFGNSNILYSDIDFIGIIDMISWAILLLFGLKNIPLCALFSFILLNIGSATLVSMNTFLFVSMIVGNLIDLYLFGIIAILISWLMNLFLFGLMLISFLVYFWITKVEFFLVFLLFLESFSYFFQSLTLSNRISINLFAGSLLTSLCSVGIISLLFSFYFVFGSFMLWFLFLIFTFEIFNASIQLWIYSLLSLEYCF